MHWKCKKIVIMKQNLKAKMILNMNRKEYFEESIDCCFVLNVFLAWINDQKYNK